MRWIYRLLRLSHISLSMYINQSEINVELPYLRAICCRPFASLRRFFNEFERFWVRRLLLKKTAFEAKGQQHIADKVIQCLFNIDDTYPFMFIKLFYINTKPINWCMSSRREVLIRILALLQRKTLIETKNRILKCLKRHYLNVRTEEVI